MLSGLLLLVNLLWPPAGVVLVYNDQGGSINDRIMEIYDLNRAGAQVQIIGECHSACTMYLGMKNVCVHPHALLTFHSAKPFKKGTNEPVHDPELQALLNQRIAAQYPDFVAEKFLREWQYMEGDEMARINGQWFIDRGIPECRQTDQ